MSDIGCETIPSKEGYAMDWRGNSHDMDDLVVKIMKEGTYKKKVTWQNDPQAYLIFVIFFHRQNFWRIKFTPKNANFSPISAKLHRNFHRKTPIFANFSR